MLSDPHDSATGPAVDRGAARLPLERSWTGADRLPRPHAEAPRGWWHDLPELVSDRVRVRELRLSDAPSLAETLASPQVSRYISPGPGSFVETEEFIVWARRARLAGRYICFGVVPPAATQAVGLFQLWPLDSSFRTAEWGFALGPRFWGTGLFEAGARLVTGFAFGTLGVVRLEARAAVDNARGNAALEKLGAVPEGVLRKCFLSNGEYRDHRMWSILADDWRAKNEDAAGRVAGEMA